MGINKIRYLRIKNNLTIQELAEKIGITREHLNQVELEKCPLSDNLAVMASEFFEVDVSELKEVKPMQMLTPKDVATMLKVSADTVKRLREQGKLNFKKIGGQWRITEDELLLCIDKMQELTEPVKQTRTRRKNVYHNQIVPIKYVNGRPHYV